MPRPIRCVLPLVLAAMPLSPALYAEDGYRLWLRYTPLTPDSASHTASITEGISPPPAIILATPSGEETPTLALARAELETALHSLYGQTPLVRIEKIESDLPAALRANTPHAREGFHIAPIIRSHRPPPTSTTLRISASSDIGVLYGTFDLLRRIQIDDRPPSEITVTSVPRIARRLLNHWDNLDGFVERGYAGNSLWHWDDLPETIDPRYHDYARAMASLGLNGTVLNNVNADARILTTEYLRKVAALADLFRPYGLRIYLSARFSAPIEIGGLPTADPLAPEVAEWWRGKSEEVYALIPDFGGFLVKANSEGQPGPHDYGRNHADGANLLAAALAPHGGIVIWRAFVYSPDNQTDRVKQAYDEFFPLDGQFAPNVVLQIKNGPLDFMPREPFSPLFGAMRTTPLAAELQITQEYLGQQHQVAFLAPMWEEFFKSETYAHGSGTTVARIVDGSLHRREPSLISGVANTGSDRNWTGHPLAQANWYAYGRFAWDHTLTSEQIAREWATLTFANGNSAATDSDTAKTIAKQLLGSRETVVNYSMPLGLHHIMATGHHYGPGPWVGDLHRDDWNPTYYHRADKLGLGFDRTPTGSNALSQYAPEFQTLWGNPKTCPPELLLWFHHLPWDYPLRSGHTLWDELCLRYQQGVDEARAMLRTWETLAGKIDTERFDDVRRRLTKQVADAIIWRDACLLYFQTFSKRPLPAGVEPPAHSLDTYKALKPETTQGNPG